MTTPPPDGTVWVFFLPDTYYSDFALRDGVMMVEPRDGSWTELAIETVADLRSWPDEYTEIPPPKGTP